MSQKQTSVPVTVLDHLAIYVRDLDRSSRFYNEILGLEEIPCPLIHRPIRWFSLGKGLSIHIIQGSDGQVSTHINHHIALQTGDLDAFLAHMNENRIKYYDARGNEGAIHRRRDGYRQIFFQDPDGYWLEMNDVELE